MQLPFPLAALTEREWPRQVYDLADLLNWRRYHTYRSTKSAAGWPDEALARERLVFLELKTETGTPSQAQKEWLAALARCGIETYLARPRHLEQLGVILTHRGDPFMARGSVREAAALLRAETLEATT